MTEKKRYRLKSILLTIVWIGIGASVAVLLVAGVRKHDARLCKGIEINIKGVHNNFFVDKTDILNSIMAIAKGNPVGKSLGSFNLGLMEKELKKNVWVKNSEMFFDNNNILQVSVLEREPIARIFSKAGATFYIDSEIDMLPLSEKFSARIPVFTGFPSDNVVLSKEDSNLLSDIKIVSLAIQKDSFRMAIIEQVDITPQRTFEMIPKIGNQLIVFGDANGAEEKFDKLQLFYKEIMVKAGWSNYSVINVQYKGQVVAKRKGAEDVTADSIRTLEIMKLIVANAEKQAADSLQIMQQDNDRNTVDSSMIQESIQRDESLVQINESDNILSLTPAKEKPELVKKSKSKMPVKKPVQKPTIIKKRNDL